MAVAGSIVVLRGGTEGLSMADYARELRRRLPDHAVRYARTPSMERDMVADAAVVTGVDIEMALLDRATELRLFACVFAGTDHLPLRALASRGVAVTNASGIHAPGVAEGAVGSMLAFARGLLEARRRDDRREWAHVRSPGLAGRTVTVVGLGAIGTAVVERLAEFSVETIGVRHTPAKGGPTDAVIGFENDALHDALAGTDYLVLACPLTETTRGLVDEAAIATLPPTAVVVNVARGPVVDTEALVDGLRAGQLRGAALDVTEPEPLPPSHPLWNFENVLITPHAGGHTPHHWPRMADIVAENVGRLAAGDELVNLVSPATGGEAGQ